MGQEEENASDAKGWATRQYEQLKVIRQQEIEKMAEKKRAQQ